MGILLQDIELQLSWFGEHLLRRHLVDRVGAQFYVRWVRKFLMEVPENVSRSLHERLTGFRQDLRKGRHEDWQIDQAERAVSSTERG